MFHLQCRHRARHISLCPRGYALCSPCSSQRLMCPKSRMWQYHHISPAALCSGLWEHPGTVLHAQSAADSSERASRERSAAPGLRVLTLSCWVLCCRHPEGLTAPRCSTWDRPPASVHQGGSCQGMRRRCACEKDVLEWSDSEPGCSCRDSAGGQK